MRNKKGNLGMAAYGLDLIESGRQDSNLRPSAPKAPALQIETVNQIYKSGYGKLVAISEEL